MKKQTEHKEFYHQRIRSKKKTKSYFRFVGTTAIVLLGLILSILYLGSNENNGEQFAYSNSNTVLEQYQTLILEGDESLTNGDYNKAASQYRSALQIIPNDSIATLRLISASDLDCVVNSENCGESDKLLGEFIEN